MHIFLLAISARSTHYGHYSCDIPAVRDAHASAGGQRGPFQASQLLDQATWESDRREGRRVDHKDDNSG
jgi:hypothetical protein